MIKEALQVEKNKTSLQKSLFYILRLLGCIFLLFLVFRRYNSTEIFAQMKDIKIHLLLMAWALNYVSIFISSAKWKSILRSYGQNAPLLHLWALYIEGQFFNLIFPGFIAGDVSRITRISKNGGVSLNAVMSVFLERFSGLLILGMFIGMVALFGGYQDLDPWWQNFILLLFLLNIVLLGVGLNLKSFRSFLKFVPGLIRKRIVPLFEKIINASYVLKEHKNLIWSLPILSLLFISMSGPVAYFASRAVDVEIPLSVLMIYAPLIAFLSNLPLSISGVGVRENLAVLFYSALGFQPEEIIAYALAQSAVLLLVNVSGGLILLLRTSRISLLVQTTMRNKHKEKVV
ncbi:MAG: UPF0104 family protein [Chloroflexi bacterium]|nr:MAG: UPF0104 family protein [Chloroflexota bacterium]